MKFRCERDILLEALATTGRAVTTRGGALPVLSGVRLELVGDSLTLTGSDLDLTISVTITVGGESDGVAVLPSRLASDIVRAVEAGTVSVSVGDGEAEITAGRSDFTVRLLPADEYPQIPEPSGDAVHLAASDVVGALRQVIKAASADDSRPILTGVLLAAEGDGLRLVATDSYRLAVRDLPGTSVLEAEQSVLVPSRALGELAKVLGEDDELELRLGERDVAFQTGTTRLMSRLIEGEFPNYRGLIPESHPNRLRVSREGFLDAVRRVRLMAQEATPVRLSMHEDHLELVAVTQDVGQAHEALDATYEGEELVVAFNPEYLLDGIEVTSGEEIVLETVDALKPAVLRSGDGGDFLYLLMPVRVS